MVFDMSASPGEIDLNCDAFPIDAPPEGLNFKGDIYSAHRTLDFDPFRGIDEHVVGDGFMDGSIHEDVDGGVCVGDHELSLEDREIPSAKKDTVLEDGVDAETLDGEDTDSVNSGELAFKSYVEDKFVVSDLVWGKVRSHPWWPGQIFEATASSAKAMEYFKRDSFLIAYFGDQSFAWNKPSLLKPFREHFSQMEKQSDIDAFRDAVDGALDEVSRRVEFGLACPCLPPKEYSLLKNQNIVNAGIRDEYSIGRNCCDRFSGVDSFEPLNLVKYVKSLAQFQWDETDKLELVLAEAQLLAFYRTKGYFQLPRFEMLGGLWDEGMEIPVSSEKHDLAEVPDIAVSLFSDSNIHVHSESTSKNGSYIKERCISDILTDSYSAVLGRKRKAVDSIHDLSSVKFKTSNISVSPGDSYLQQSRSQSPKIGDRIHRAAMELNGRDTIFKFDDEMAEIVTVDEENKNSKSSKGRGSGKGRGRPKKIPVDDDELDDVLLIVTGDNRRIDQISRAKGRGRPKKNAAAIPVDIDVPESVTDMTERVKDKGNNDAPESVANDNNETKKGRGRPKKIRVENDSNEMPETVRYDKKETSRIERRGRPRKNQTMNEMPETVRHDKNETSRIERRGRPRKNRRMENDSNDATSSQHGRGRTKRNTMERDLHSRLFLAARDPLRVFPSLNRLVSFFSDFRDSVCVKTSLDFHETSEFEAAMDSCTPISEPEIEPPALSSSHQSILPDVGIQTGYESTCDHKVTTGIDPVDPNLSWNYQSIVADVGVKSDGQSICSHQTATESDPLHPNLGWYGQSILPDLGFQTDHQIATRSKHVDPNLHWSHQSIVPDVGIQTDHETPIRNEPVDPNLQWNHRSIIVSDLGIHTDHQIATKSEPMDANLQWNHRSIVPDVGIQTDHQIAARTEPVDPNLQWKQQGTSFSDVGIQTNHRIATRSEPMDQSSQWNHQPIVSDVGIQTHHQIVTRNEPVDPNLGWKKQVSEETEEKSIEGEDEEEQTPTALILCFTDINSVPSEKRLNDIFRVYGWLEESETKVMKNSFSAKVVFKKRCDAEIAFSSAGKFSIFGPSLVSYRLKYLSSVRRRALNCKTRRTKKEKNEAAS